MSTPPDCVRLRFEGASRTFNIHKWSIPGHDLLFEPLPLDTRLCIPQRKGLYTNRPVDKRSREVDLAEAVSWGLDDEAHVIYACASRHYCVRFIFHAERVLRAPGSQSLQAYRRLVRDAQFHSTHLQNSKIKGFLVPVHYGMWVTNTGDWAGKVIMSVTQYCGMHWNELQYSRMGTQANRELVGRAFEKLHDCGFEHGKMDTDRDFRHAVIDIFEPGLTPQEMKDGEARCYIVDFSEATANHQCARRLPVLPLDKHPAQFGCRELVDVAFSLDFFNRRNIEQPVTAQALAWHDQYISDHPDVPNQYVLMEQRAQFFSEYRTLYPALALVHDPEGRIDIRMSSESDDETAVDSDRTNSASPETVAGGLKQLTLDDPDP
ncbi:hypothetical protein FB45DRAFT_1052671 [Roridomyces roridus]|uniref:Protein kinase domain-containing protein n=1 Tax=Roridomyces roridus TaxID=1738132 RepID=A0AAD7CCI4_9AGAR|nr:hypothetical protein FB45DRAFT_1052671 [Roridomyces roridus]